MTIYIRYTLLSYQPSYSKNTIKNPYIEGGCVKKKCEISRC